MKQLYYEIEKLLKNKLFIFLFIGLAVGSLISFVWTQLSVINSEEYSEEKLAVQYREDYNAALTELNALDTDSAIEKIQQQKNLYEMCMTISSILSDDRAEMDQQSALNGLKMQNKETYNNAMQLFDKEGIDFREKAALYELMLQKFQYIKSYRTFIGEMEVRSEHQLSFSVFSDNDAFSEANIKKTVSDFAPLRGTEAKAGNYLFVEHGTSHFITDIMAMAVMFLLCMCLFMQEYEKGLLLLVKSCRNGHSLTAVSKLLTLGIFTVITVVVFYGIELVASGMIYGLPDLNVPVQSMRSFMDCSLKISVGEYLLMWLSAKLLIMLTAVLLFSVVFNLFRSTALIWSVSLGFMTLEYILYLTVSPKSNFNHLHFIDLFHFLDSKTLLDDYENLNVFSTPVNMLIIFPVICISVIGVSVAASILLFSSSSQITSRSMLSSLIERLKTKILPVCGSTSILRHELYKRMIHDKGIIVLAVLLLLAVDTVKQNITIKYDSLPDVTYYAYLEQLEGRLTPEKEQYIETEQKRFNDMKNKLMELETQESKTQEEVSRMGSLETILKGKYKGFQMLMEHYDYLKEQRETKGTEIWFISEKKYSYLLTDSNGSAGRFLLCAAALTLLLGNVFALEYKRNMKRLLKATSFGQNQLFAAKLFTSLICGAVCFLLVYIPVLFRHLNSFGTVLTDAPIASLRQFSECGNEMTLLGYLILTAFLYLGLTLLMSLLVCCVSELTRSHFLSLLLSSIVFLIVYFILIGDSSLRIYALIGGGKIIAFIIGVAVVSLVTAGIIILSNRRFLYDRIRRA